MVNIKLLYSIDCKNYAILVQNANKNLLVMCKNIDK